MTYLFQSSDALIEQDLYPYATGGPVTYVPPDQELWGEASLSVTPGWYQTPLGFFRYLVDRGLPERNSVAAVAPVRPAAGASRMQSGPWRWIVVALIGLAALTRAPVAMGRRVVVVRR